jgi:hypothetical protein
MRDPKNRYLKAWAAEYEEAPFFFEEKSQRGSRIVAWSEETKQTQEALFAVIDSLPWDVDILLKVCVGHDSKDQPLWSRYHGVVQRSRLVEAIEANEKYIFSDGMHQLCLKDPESDRYLAFDDHGIFFLYSPFPTDSNLFKALGFEERYAEPLFANPHFQCTPKGSEEMEQRFVAELQLDVVGSDLD